MHFALEITLESRSVFERSELSSCGECWPFCVESALVGRSKHVSKMRLNIKIIKSGLVIETLGFAENLNSQLSWI